MSFTLVWLVTALLFGVVGTATYQYYRYSNRGFEITDEAIFYLQAQRPQDVKCYPFFDFAYWAPVFRWCGENVVFMRRLMLPLLFISEILFAFGCYRALGFFNATFLNFATLLLFVGVALTCTFTRFCFGSRVPFYNHISAFLLLTSSGLILTALFSPYYTSIVLLTLFAIAGYCTGMQLFIKVSNALAVSVGQLLLVTLSTFLPIIQRAEFVVVYLVGFSVACVVHFLFIFSPKSTWETFHNQVETGKAFGWGASCLPRHAQELRHYYREIARRDSYYWAVVLNAAWICWLVSFLDPSIAQVFLFLAGVLFLKLCERAFQDGVLKSKHYAIETSIHFHLARLQFFGFAVALSLVALMPESQLLAASTLFTAFVVAGFLIGLPIASCVGTGNQLYHNLVFQISPWGLGVSAALLYLGLAAGFLPVALCAIGVLSWVTLKNYLHGMIRDPYRIKGTLDDQTVPVHIGKNTNVLLEPTTAKVFAFIRSAFEENGFKPGDNIIGLFDVPGLVFLVDGVSPGHQWFYGFLNSDVTEMMQQTNYKHLAAVPESERRKAFIVTQGDVSAFNKHFDALGMQFPLGYVSCGSVVHYLNGTPITVWKPLEHVVSTDKVSPLVPVVTASAALKGGDATPALQLISVIDRAIMPNPDSYVTLGNLLLAQGKTTEALRCLSVVLEKFPENIEAGISLATLMIKLERIDVAEGLLKNVLGKSLSDPRVLNLLAAIFEMRGHFDEAKKVRQAMVSMQH